MLSRDYDWNADFHEKDKYLRVLYDEVSPKDFYRELFPVGSTARKNEVKANKGNIVACRFTNKGNGDHMRHFNVGNDLTDEELQYVLGYKGAYMTPVSYFGKKRDKNHSHLLFAIVIDVDNVTILNLMDMVYQYSNPQGYYFPEPTFIVNSSRGVHLYYLLKKPYELRPKRSDFENRANAIKELKRAMIRQAWNPYTSSDKKRDAPNIWQIFRAVGSKTKFDDGSVVSAYRVNPHRFDFDELNDRFKMKVDLSALHHITKAEYDKKVATIKKKYPAYYQRVIVEKQAPKRKGCFDFPPQMYYKWVTRVGAYGQEGHRYFCIKVLFATAIKCNIPRKQALNDAMRLLPILDRRTNLKEPFTKEDVMSAYREAYQSGEDKTDLMHRLPTKWIVDNTAIDLPIAKRNGRKQEEHLKRARAVQSIDFPNGEWRNKDGRPSKSEAVREWRKSHPDGKKIDCERDTGLSRHTILKWWNEQA